MSTYSLTYRIINGFVYTKNDVCLGKIFRSKETSESDITISKDVTSSVRVKYAGDFDFSESVPTYTIKTGSDSWGISASNFEKEYSVLTRNYLLALPSGFGQLESKLTKNGLSLPAMMIFNKGGSKYTLGQFIDYRKPYAYAYTLAGTGGRLEKKYTASKLLDHNFAKLNVPLYDTVGFKVDNLKSSDCESFVNQQMNFAEHLIFYGCDSFADDNNRNIWFSQSSYIKSITFPDITDISKIPTSLGGTQTSKLIVYVPAAAVVNFQADTLDIRTI